ncbi:MAG: hypothetical protein GXY44_06795 [Phycisphaerales bacterium]|nr:hypothetical protein [Phycisphaerales bacterium]
MVRRTLLTMLICGLASGQRCVPGNDDDWTPGDPDPRVTIQTSKGDIEIELFARQAPQSVENFQTYINDGYYNDTIIYSVTADSSIQAGRFRTDYRGKPNRPLSNESTNGLRNIRGRVALYGPAGVTEGIPAIHINISDNKYLDYDPNTGQKPDYTVIGRIVRGMEIVAEISRMETENKGSGLERAPKEMVEITGACGEPPCTGPVDPDEGDDVTDGDDEQDFITTASGLKYKDVIIGNGPVITPDAMVVAFYTGRLTNENGAIFDTTEGGGQPRTFPLSGVIAGWQEGLGNYDMRVGGTRILIIPPELGYGEFGSGDRIPPNSILWFEVEVVDLD